MTKKAQGVSLKSSVVFLGGGNMAEALIGGLVKSGTVAASRVTATDVREERLSYLRKTYGVRTSTDNAGAVSGADVVFIAVKPGCVEALLKEISPKVSPSCLFISIAAGITTRYIEKNLPKGTAVIRTMPNTPVLLGAAAIGLSTGKKVSREQASLAVKLLSTVGTVAQLPESKINAVTALSGSGPAYVFFLAEAMERAGVKMGLPKDVARELARRTVYGAGRMLAELDTPAAELRRNVTSPGGTTHAAITALEENDFTGIFERALKKAQVRAKELSK